MTYQTLHSSNLSECTQYRLTYDYEFSSIFDRAPSLHIKYCPVVFFILMIKRYINYNMITINYIKIHANTVQAADDTDMEKDSHLHRSFDK